ncbi:hypothetical protein CsSME_00016719 [Camellia sinensis var. sinensis]
MAALLTFLVIIATAFFFLHTFAIPTAIQLEVLETTPRFSYSGNTGLDKWGSLSPSPIDIVNNKVVRNKKLKPSRKEYYPVNATLVNNGYNVALFHESIRLILLHLRFGLSNL